MQPHLDHLYAGQARTFSLNVRSLTDYTARQGAFRDELARLLGLLENAKG